jgi:FkbH-like protein
VNQMALLGRIRALRAPDAVADRQLLADLGAATDPTLLAEAGRLLADVPVPLLWPERRLKPLRVAVAATFTASAVAPLLRLALLRAGIDPVLHVAGFDQLLLELSDPDAELAAFRPELTLALVHDGALLPPRWDPADPAGARTAALDRVERLEQAVAGFLARVPGTVLLHTVPLSNAEYRSVLAYRGKAALGRVWREVNTALLEFGDRHERAYTLDLESLLVHHPGALADDRLARFASMAWTPAVEHRYAREAAKFARALTGQSKKCLVLDLDNTLWGGVVGDDGPGGVHLGPLYPGNCYVDLQRRAEALRRQGVLLALASKNTESVVDEVFADHPEMVLGADAFVARRIDWEPKDGNIRAMAESLNIGLDSLVFLDDSRFECDLVRMSLPEVTTVHLAGDPAGFSRLLLDEGWFDVLRTTGTDAERTELYRARVRRAEFSTSFTSSGEYLRGLGLRVEVRPADRFTLPRLVQLGLRTNQFTMTARPHSEARTREMAGSSGHRVLVFEVADRFGREGVVGGVWLAAGEDAWTVENFVMSCRVFARGIEHAVFQHLVDLATAAGAGFLHATFERTGRNGPAERFFAGLDGGVPTGTGTTVAYRYPLHARPGIRPDWIDVPQGGPPCQS